MRWRLSLLLALGVVPTFCGDFDGVGINDPRVAAMLGDLFGDLTSMQTAAAAWETNKVHDAAATLSRPVWTADGRPEVALWLRLTQLLTAVGRYDSREEHNRYAQIAGTSVARSSINRFYSKRALSYKVSKGLRCAETGDGHFLTTYYTRVCSHMAVLDRYRISPELETFHADLNLPIASQLPAAGGGLLASFDVVVSSSVFEHLKSPSCAMANLNALLRAGGRLEFTVPFLYRDHGAPDDYSRFTVQNVRRLLRCGGFALRVLRGRGNMASAVFDVAGVPGAFLPEADLRAGCDALVETKGCTNQHYLVVEALGVKIANASCKMVRSCFA